MSLLKIAIQLSDRRINITATSITKVYGNSYEGINTQMNPRNLKVITLQQVFIFPFSFLCVFRALSTQLSKGEFILPKTEQKSISGFSHVV